MKEGLNPSHSAVETDLIASPAFVGEWVPKWVLFLPHTVICLGSGVWVLLI